MAQATQSIFFPIGLPQGVPIPANPPADLPLTGNEILLLSQDGVTVQTPLSTFSGIIANLALQFYTVSTSTVTLSDTANVHLINNTSGGAITISPPAIIPLNWLAIVSDYSATAGTSALSMNAIVNGQSAPVVIVNVNGGFWQGVYYTAGSQFVRIG